jgi:hypothetical protein
MSKALTAGARKAIQANEAKKRVKKAEPERPKSVVVTPNERQARVAQAIMEGHTETDAVRAAGYHPASASNVMKQEGIQQALAEARKGMEDISTIKRVDVMNIFLEAIEMARIQADPANMINGADKIAKMMGYYAPETKRIELTSDHSVLQSKLRQLSDAELYEIAGGKAKVIEGEVLQ